MTFCCGSRGVSKYKCFVPICAWTNHITYVSPVKTLKKIWRQNLGVPFVSLGLVKYWKKKTIWPKNFEKHINIFEFSQQPYQARSGSFSRTSRCGASCPRSSCRTGPSWWWGCTWWSPGTSSTRWSSSSPSRTSSCLCCRWVGLKKMLQVDVGK